MRLQVLVLCLPHQVQSFPKSSTMSSKPHVAEEDAPTAPRGQDPPGTSPKRTLFSSLLQGGRDMLGLLRPNATAVTPVQQQNLAGVPNQQVASQNQPPRDTPTNNPEEATNPQLVHRSPAIAPAATASKKSSRKKQSFGKKESSPKERKINKKMLRNVIHLGTTETTEGESKVVIIKSQKLRDRLKEIQT